MENSSSLVRTPFSRHGEEMFLSLGSAGNFFILLQFAQE